LIFGPLIALPPIRNAFVRFGACGFGAAGFAPRRTSIFEPAAASPIGANCTTVKNTASQALGRLT
jgi:hypothetical protein